MQQVQTKLSLERFRQITGANPLAFWGVQIDETQRDHLDQTLFQYGWQRRDAVSRSELAEAIRSAEDAIEGWVRYHLLPDWTVDEWQGTPRPLVPSMFNTNARDLRGFHQPVELNRGHFIEGGVRASTLIEAAANITYSSTRPPTDYLDTASITVTVPAGQAADEIHVYYPGHDGDPVWEIRPIDVSITDTTATITFARAMCVIESLLQTEDIEDIRAVNGRDNDAFLTTVDVYRVYTDTSQQVGLLWDPRNGLAYTERTGVMLLHGDPRLGVVSYSAATYADGVWTGGVICPSGAPDVVRLSYRSGWRDRTRPLPNIQMDPFWEQAVARLATAYITRQPPLDRLAAFWTQWSQDLAYESGGEQISRYKTPRALLENPLGTSRAAVRVWQDLNQQGRRVGFGA